MAHAINGGLEDYLGRLCRRFGVAELYVFGSRATEIAARMRGETPAVDERQSTSDADVGIRPLPRVFLGVDSLVDLADELERCLHVPRVDVVLLPTASPFLALEIIRGELLYAADPDAQAEYELYVLRAQVTSRLPAPSARARAVEVRGSMTPEVMR